MKVSNYQAEIVRLPEKKLIGIEVMATFQNSINGIGEARKTFMGKMN
jgi:hypothetical protein